MKPIDVTTDSYAEYSEDSNKNEPKFKVGGRVRISKYKSIFANGCIQNWSEEFFIISKVKNAVTWTYAISESNGEPITGSFCEKELQKIDQQEFRIEKTIERKG